MSDDMARLEGLAIGLEQRGEKSAAQQIRLAYAEIERLRALRIYDATVIRDRDDYSDQLEARLTETAAFLGQAARRCESAGLMDALATDCRAMAAKLRK